MLSRAITLMAGKSIAGMLPFQLAHHRISSRFGQYGGCSNAQGPAFPFGQRKVRIGQPGPVDIIEQQVFGEQGQHFESAHDRLPRGR